jgi:hypothetical protein
MARAWRIEYEGTIYHVLSRGNQKQNIVISDDDRRLILANHKKRATQARLPKVKR